MAACRYQKLIDERLPGHLRDQVFFSMLWKDGTITEHEDYLVLEDALIECGEDPVFLRQVLKAAHYSVSVNWPGLFRWNPEQERFLVGDFARMWNGFDAAGATVRDHLQRALAWCLATRRGMFEWAFDYEPYDPIDDLTPDDVDQMVANDLDVAVQGEFGMIPADAVRCDFFLDRGRNTLASSVRGLRYADWAGSKDRVAGRQAVEMLLARNEMLGVFAGKMAKRWQDYKGARQLLRAIRATRW